MRLTNRVSSFGATGSCAVALCVLACAVDVQSLGQSIGGAAGNDSGARITGTQSPWGTPATTNENGRVDQSHSVFLRGNVQFDDGSSPDRNVRIERVCGATVRVETHADSKGRFFIRLGGDVASNIAEADSSDNNLGTARSAIDQASVSDAAQHCELRAAYPGYVSDSIDLSPNSSTGSQTVGTLLLRRLVNVRGTTISATTALAPKSAQKSFAKGYQLFEKGKFADAELMFKSATSDDPKFAIAWFAFGQVEQRLKKPDDAVKCYLAAIAADDRYVSPYNQLSLLSGELGNWQDAVKYSQQAIDLNPVELPSSFWYNAIANYNLKNDAQAEKSARALVKLDSQHRFPQVETMLAEFAVNRRDWQEAAAHLRTFLSEAPAAPNAASVKQQLARIEAAASTQAKGSPPSLH